MEKVAAECASEDSNDLRIKGPGKEPTASWQRIPAEREGYSAPASFAGLTRNRRGPEIHEESLGNHIVGQVSGAIVNGRSGGQPGP